MHDLSKFLKTTHFHINSKLQLKVLKVSLVFPRPKQDVFPTIIHYLMCLEPQSTYLILNPNVSLLRDPVN